MFIKRKRKPLKLSDEEWQHLQERASKTEVDLPPPEPPTATDESEWQKTWDLFNEKGRECIEERRKKLAQLQKEGDK